jgi:hypothetical protein
MYALIFSSRSDGGPKHVGPFAAREGANGHLSDLKRPGFSCSVEIVSLATPIQSIRREKPHA